MAKNIDIDSLLSDSIDDTDPRVLYEEKIDLDELQNAVDEFYENATANMKNSIEKINAIEDEFAKINNSQKFYYGGEAAHQHGNLNIASRHFDDLQTVSLFSNPNSIIRIAENFNTKLVEKKHKVRVTLCQKKIDLINGNVVSTRTEKEHTNKVLLNKTEQVDEVYEENYFYILREVFGDGSFGYDCTITKRIHIIDPATKDSKVTEGNVKEMEQKVLKTGNSLPYIISSIVDYDD